MPISPASTPGHKMPSPFDNIFNKSFQFYPNLLNQPINYSRRSENDSNSNNSNNSSNVSNYRYQNHKTSNQDKFTNNSHNDTDDGPTCLTKKTSSSSSNCGGESNQKKTKISDMRKIDRIAENLRCATATKNFFDQHHKLPLMLPPTPATSLMLKPSQIPSLPHQFLGDDAMGIPKTPENLFLDANHNQSMTMQSAGSNGPMHHDNALDKLNAAAIKTANSKLYAKCFICHKQLSNQYNLRVHLETHQNVR